MTDIDGLYDKKLILICFEYYYLIIIVSHMAMFCEFCLRDMDAHISFKHAKKGNQILPTLYCSMQCWYNIATSKRTNAAEVDTHECQNKHTVYTTGDFHIKAICKCSNEFAVCDGYFTDV
jgi:hypothetical protein